MRGFEVVTCEVEHQRMVRTVKMIRDADTLEPYFPASIWLMNEYHRNTRKKKPIVCCEDMDLIQQAVDQGAIALQRKANLLQHLNADY